MSMRMFWLAVLCVWCVGAVSAATSLPSDGVLSSTILTGPVFTIIGVNNTDNDLTGHSIVLVTNQINGTAVPLNGPELRVVANTTVYFALTGFWPANAVSTYSYPAGFGLTSSSTITVGQRMSGDPVGLTPTPASVSAGSCYSYIENDSSASGYVQPNTFALNYTVNFSATDTGYKTYSTSPCVLQWQVPANATGTNATTNYYYFEPFTPSTPRRIYIVASDPNTPSTGPGTGSGSGGNTNGTTAPPTTATPTTASPTTAAPTGTGSSSPTPNGTSSSTGSNPPSSAFASAHVSGWAALVAALATIAAAAAAL